MISSSTQNYISILEKTNQQLSLWYNPFGLMIGVLTLLIALLAVYFAYILWRQGRDYKDFLEEQKKIIGEETRLYAKSVLDERIVALNKEMESLAGEARKKVEKEVSTLKEASRSLNKSLTYRITPSPYRSNPFEAALQTKKDSNLSVSQIDAIISLLQSFGSDAKTIQDVEHALRD